MYLRAASRRLRAPLLASATLRSAFAAPRITAYSPATALRPLRYSTGPDQPGNRPAPPGGPKTPSSESNPPGDGRTPDGKLGKPEEEEEEIPLSSLPDLTQGIPSTLEHETAGAMDKAALTALEESTASGGGRKKGELPASAYVSSSEKRRQKVANYFFAAALGMGVAGTAYLGRDWDDEEAKKHADKIPNGWGLGLWWRRASARMGDLLSYYREPAFEKLLPDPDPVYWRPYTLCISLEDMLIHSEWTREHGWRIAKRPGVDYFLHYLSQYYELVLFTTVPSQMAEPMVRKLDPYHFITFPLFREATKYENGEMVKDLSYLNRDLSKVIILDTNAAHVRTQPENAIVLPKWTGDAKDRQLVALIPFLEYIFTMKYGDVRKVLKSFEGTDIPTEFARREAIARAEFQKQLESHRGKRVHKASSEGGIGRLGSMLGLKSSTMSGMVQPEGEANLAEQLAQGKMLQDIAREQGQRTYEMMEKEIRENGEKWLKEEAAMQEKMQQEAMQNMKQSFTGWFVDPSKMPPPEKKA